MTQLTYRLWSFLLVVVTLAVLAASYYFELIKGLNPCPLCLMQRFCVILLLFTTALGFYLHQSSKAKKVLIAQILVAGMGIFFALRQVWLQSLPLEQTSVCLPGLTMMIHYLPWQDVLYTLFLGASDCAETPWTWLGLSMPAWTALYFSGIVFATLISYFHLKANKQ